MKTKKTVVKGYRTTSSSAQEVLDMKECAESILPQSAPEKKKWDYWKQEGMASNRWWADTGSRSLRRGTNGDEGFYFSVLSTTMDTDESSLYADGCGSWSFFFSERHGGDRDGH